jgi:hypothetical protein
MTTIILEFTLKECEILAGKEVWFVNYFHQIGEEIQRKILQPQKIESEVKVQIR